MLAGDRVSGTDADRHDDISDNGSSGFGGSADDSAETDLRLCTHYAQIASVALYRASYIGYPPRRRWRPGGHDGLH